MKTNPEKFLAQSYHEAWDNYAASIENDEVVNWDWVIITASNERQAEAYRLQIKKRQDQNLIPAHVHFEVIADIGGQRIGSGGATLHALSYIAKKIGVEQVSNQKILLLHSGGDSKRIPQYSAPGKLFAPVPHYLMNNNRATAFDDLLMAVSGIPARTSAGMLVLPSDTELIFSPLQLDLESVDAAGLSIKAPVSEGVEHGVFVSTAGKLVSRFLHKQSKASLYAGGAVDGRGHVDIDTGCIWVGAPMVAALLDLVCTDNMVSAERFDSFVNPEVCLSFYADFVYPLATGSTLDDYYQQTPEGTFSTALKQCREQIWSVLHGFNLSLIRLAPAKYLHFGMTHEVHSLITQNIGDYAQIGWQRQTMTSAPDTILCAANNALISDQAEVAETSYIENSRIGAGCIIGERAVVSGMDLEAVKVPDGLVVHGLILENGKWICRIYGLNDNPKESLTSIFLNSSLDAIIQRAEVAEESIWDGGTASIWNAAIYPVAATAQQAFDASMALYKLAQNNIDPAETQAWIAAERMSLSSSFQAASLSDILDREAAIEHEVRTKKFITALQEGQASKNAITELSIGQDLIEELDAAFTTAQASSFPLNAKLYLALADICRARKLSLKHVQSNTLSCDDLEDLAYRVVEEETVSAVFNRHLPEFDGMHFQQNRVIIELPIRVNFCGSPSDAAPYCLEHGGNMLDGAFLLFGKYPISAEIERIDGEHLVFSSSDLGANIDISNLSEIRNCGNPNELFAIHKAVLIATGLVSQGDESEDLKAFCARIGGGFKLSTRADVPKGSGLGTSSIIAAACIKAINLAFDLDTSDQCIYAQVFATEQLMGTGGGWQDQVGGLTPGLKYFSTYPGSYQNIEVEHLTLPASAQEQLEQRFALIYSGQRRLARNVLRVEMNQCLRNDQDALAAVERIRELTSTMRYQLYRGNITAFGACMSEQLECVKKLDRDATNTYIDYIFDVCDDLIDGKSVCGAGGGGFLQVILKQGVSKADLKARIEAEFADCGVSVWDCSLLETA